MDLHERDDLKEFLTTLYGPQVNGWAMNDELFNLTYKLVSESSSCSDAMDFVPRPLAPGKEPIKWLTKQVRSMFLRALKERKEYYVSCLKAAAYNMKPEFEMAAQGV